MNLCGCKHQVAVAVNNNCVETFDKKVFLGNISKSNLQELLNYGFCEKNIDINSQTIENFGYQYNQLHGVPNPNTLISLEFLFNCYCNDTNLDNVKQFFPNTMLNCPKEEFVLCGTEQTLICSNNEFLNC